VSKLAGVAGERAIFFSMKSLMSSR
jgi:hypothetical protein